MAIHKTLETYTRVTKFQCDSCHRYMEEHERKFFSKTTRDVTEQLCPSCYKRAKTFQWVTSTIFVIIAGSLAVAALLSLF